MADQPESPAEGQPRGASETNPEDGFKSVPFILQPIEKEDGLVLEITVDFEGPPKVAVRRQRRRVPPRRTPNLAVMRERVELCTQLVGELTHLRGWLAKLVARPTPGRLKQRFPEFRLWDLLRPEETGELAAGVEDFRPRAFAENLVLRKYGLTSRETLKYYRRMLREHQRK